MCLKGKHFSKRRAVHADEGIGIKLLEKSGLEITLRDFKKEKNEVRRDLTHRVGR